MDCFCLGCAGLCTSYCVLIVLVCADLHTSLDVLIVSVRRGSLPVMLWTDCFGVYGTPHQFWCTDCVSVYRPLHQLWLLLVLLSIGFHISYDDLIVLLCVGFSPSYDVVIVFVCADLSASYDELVVLVWTGLHTSHVKCPGSFSSSFFFWCWHCDHLNIPK